MDTFIQNLPKYIISFVFLSILLTGKFSHSQYPSNVTPPGLPKADYYAVHAHIAPIIDGKANDACWENAEWKPIDQLWLGLPAIPTDFSGRYKITWTSDKLYILAEITDNLLSDKHSNPLDHYWDDDCLEFFIDENRSGGIHQYNHNAFAYHIALDARIIDLGVNRRPREYTDHARVKRITTDNLSSWEIALNVYTDQYIDGRTKNPRAELKAGKMIGYALAYCDADSKGYRESFYGSIFIPGKNKDRAYIDASTFGTLMLIE